MPKSCGWGGNSAARPPDDLMSGEGEILKRNGFGFKKKFGQNFLSDQNLLRAIAEDAGVEKTTTVLEIGAGAGALTRILAGCARRVVAYEIDPDLKPVLAETLRGCENAEVVFRDFMREDLPALEKELKEYVVVANLPYYITTPVVLRFLEEAALCRGITVMVQEEVAARFSAREGTPEYGAITAAIALRGTCEITRKVPRTLLYPRPNVDSAVVRIRFTGGVAVQSEKMYRAVVRAAFSSRRKTLENNLMTAFLWDRAAAHALLEEAGFPANVRGETLSPAMFARLADLISARS